MAQIVVTETEDYRDNLLPAGITDIIFDIDDTAFATFAPEQFGGANPISNTVTVTGDNDASNIISIVTSEAVVFSAADWTLANWGPGDQVRLSGSGNNQTLVGSTGNDLIFGRGGLDSLAGGGGLDSFQISTGDAAYLAGSSIDGGSNAGGRDRITAAGLAGTSDLTDIAIVNVEELFLAADNAVTQLNGEQLNADSIARVSAAPGITHTVEIHDDLIDLTGVAFAGWNAGDYTIHLFGNDLSNNSLVGSNRADRMDGAFMSSDTMTGAAGADTMQGGMGADVFRYTAPGHAVAGESVHGGSGTDLVRLEGAGGQIDFREVTIQQVEILRFLSGEWTARVTAAQITAGAITFVEASPGADALIVHAALGTADLSAVSFNLWNSAADSITLLGTAADDTLIGSFHDDRLNGAGGIDDLRGGPGDDTYNVNNANDAITEAAGAGMDLVISSAASYTLSAAQEIENLTLSGSGDIDGTGNALANQITGNSGDNALSGGNGHDTLNGEAGNDLLAGGSGADTLNGGGGADTLIGGKGADVMNGGGGADLFRFAAASTQADTINGFSTAQDSFDLSGGLFTNRVEAGGNTTLTHAGGTIVVTGITGLSLGDWNDLVGPSDAAAGASWRLAANTSIGADYLLA